MAVETPTWFSGRRIEVGLTITIPPSATGHLVLCLGWSGDEKMIEHGDVDDDSCFRYCKSISITLYVYSMWMCIYIYMTLICHMFQNETDDGPTVRHLTSCCWCWGTSSSLVDAVSWPGLPENQAEKELWDNGFLELYVNGIFLSHGDTSKSSILD